MDGWVMLVDSFANEDSGVNRAAETFLFKTRILLFVELSFCEFHFDQDTCSTVQ